MPIRPSTIRTTNQNGVEIMAGSTFVYVTFIRTSPEDLWSALTNQEFMRKYWFGVYAETDWKVGSQWKLKFPDGRIADTGEVVEIDSPKRLVLQWRNEFKPELKAEGYSRCVFEIEPVGDAVRLTITHSMERDNAKFMTPCPAAGRVFSLTSSPC